MRNLSYHVHKEVPGAERFQDPSALQAPGSAGPQRKKKDDAGCFGGKKAKGERETDNYVITTNLNCFGSQNEIASSINHMLLLN